VKKRIGEWEKLYVQSAASAEQMEFFFRKAQQAMLERLDKNEPRANRSDSFLKSFDSEDIAAASSIDSQVNDYNAPAAAVEAEEEEAEEEAVDTTPKVAAVIALNDNEISNEIPTTPVKVAKEESPVEKTEKIEAVSTPVTVANPPAAVSSTPNESVVVPKQTAASAVVTPSVKPEEIAEDFLINDTKIYNVSSFDKSVDRYIYSAFKMNHSLNRIPLVCGVFGRQSTAAKPPIDVFAAAIKTYDDTIFLAVTVIVAPENELNPFAYGLKKIVIMAKRMEIVSYLKLQFT
jgi:hypothetical protein